MCSDLKYQWFNTHTTLNCVIIYLDVSYCIMAFLMWDLSLDVNKYSAYKNQNKIQIIPWFKIYTSHKRSMTKLQQWLTWLLKDLPLLSIISLPSDFIHSEEVWLDMEERDMVDMLKVLIPPDEIKQPMKYLKTKSWKTIGYSSGFWKFNGILLITTKNNLYKEK